MVENNVLERKGSKFYFKVNQFDLEYGLLTMASLIEAERITVERMQSVSIEAAGHTMVVGSTVAVIGVGPCTASEATAFGVAERKAVVAIAAPKHCTLRTHVPSF